MKRILGSLLIGFVLVGFVGQLAAQDPVASSSAAKGTKPAAKKLNIFALLSPEIENHAREVSERVKKETGLSPFCLEGYQVHATLYMTLFPEGKLEQVKSLVASEAPFLSPIEVRTSGVALTKDNWLFVNLEKNQRFQELSDHFVVALSPLRLMDQHAPAWTQNYPQKLKFFEQFGSPNVFAEFEPHLTLLASTKGDVLPNFIAKNASDPLFLQPVSGKIIGMGIAEADGAGQMKEKILTVLFEGK